MMTDKKTLLNGEWTLYYVPNRDVKELRTPAELAASGWSHVPAAVPGNFERDLERAGVIPDPFFGTNYYDNYKYESYHLFYVRSFDFAGEPGERTVLRFEGLDTVADVYVNGELVGHTDDMMVPFEFAGANLRRGNNEIVVHITPAQIASSKFPMPVWARGGRGAGQSLYIRKAPHMFGWDIMPRIVTGGIWRDVYVEERSPDRVDDVFFYVNSMDTAKKTASVVLFYNLSLHEDEIKDYSLEAVGVCGDSQFKASCPSLWDYSGRLEAWFGNCKFWWPANYGEPNLYDITVTLSYKGSPVYEYKLRSGVRTIKLDRTSVTDEAGSGEFCFYINGKKTFWLGSNWVPVDAFHSNDKKRLPEILPMLRDIGCNSVRCWGGNVYEDDIFYDYCDEHGIMVWQDFSLACMMYPNDDYFCSLFEREVTKTVLRLRSRACIVLWAGDNEIDRCSPRFTADLRRDPNTNLLTRNVIPKVLHLHDFTRPYLPSSPYVDETAFKAETVKEGRLLPEEHLWGPRDYFKGSFYKGSICHFASETGYHGCNSPKSLERFISPEQLWPWRQNPEDRTSRPCKPDWAAHCTAAEVTGSTTYRIPLMANQVKTLFGEEFEELDKFARASQISQAEAKKYFIERFRVTKWRRTGIIWWNLVDGWPQISDAVVDYYGIKKLAYHYIKRSQQPLCLIFDEPDAAGLLPLHVVSDRQEDVRVRYEVVDLTSGEKLTEGECVAESNQSVKLWSKPLAADEKHFLLMKWEYDAPDGQKVSGVNHYMTNIINIDYDEYVNYMKKCGFWNEFEAF